MNKIAIAGFAVLMLGGSAALAQPYGYGRSYGYGQAYGYGQYGDQGYNRWGEHYVCGRNLAHVVNLIVDPATGRVITQAEYQARYPWTNSSTWTYDCASNLWTDHTSDYQQSQNYERYRGRYRR